MEDLHPKYYLHNFTGLLGFLELRYQEVLQERELAFIKQFRALPEDAQCLYLRMANRRGTIFKGCTFSYEEIADIPSAIDALLREGFALAPSHDDWCPEIAKLLTKEETLAVLQQAGINTKGLNAMKKPALAAFLQQALAFKECLSQLHHLNLLVQAHTDIFEYLLFLYFGNLRQDMTEFVLQQVGNVQYEQFDERDFVPYFLTRKDADDKFYLAKLRESFYEWQEAMPPEELFHEIIRRLPERESLSGSAHATFDRLCVRLGEWMEKNRLHERALNAYQLTTRPPSLERQTRLLHRQGLAAEAEALCKQILAMPQSASEKYFALDFLQKLQGKSLKSTTAYLKQAPACAIPPLQGQSVELGVAQWYEAQGYSAYHHENMVWRALFGLLFWDIIFEAETDSLHHPFQRVPSDLYQPVFYEKRAQSMEVRFQLLSTPIAIQEHLRALYGAKEGIFNPFVYWHPSVLDGALLYAQYLRPSQIQAVMVEMAKNVRENASGLPDFFIHKADEYCFVEVKSPTDSLSAQQLHWLSFFAEQGIRAQALRVKFKG